MQGENGTPETPDWCQPEPKACPYQWCVCESEQHAIAIHEPHIQLSDN